MSGAGLHRRARRARGDEGWVLVSAIVLLGIMMTVGLTAYAWTDSGTSRSREDRQRESAFSVAEGALYAQGFALAQRWPNEDQPLPGDCTQAVGVVDYCPTPDNLASGSTTSQLKNVDLTAGNVKWATLVRDNSYPLDQAYDPARANDAQTSNGKTCAAPCRYDFNGDRQVWVQAWSVVYRNGADTRGTPRNLVGRLKLEELRESLPSAAVIAGGIDVSNNGNKNMIDGLGSSVLVRCTNLTSSGCVNYEPGQITPAPVAQATQPPLLTPAQLQRFKSRAQTDGRYYAGCPAKDPVTGKYDLSGTVVWVENCPSSPNFANNVGTVDCTVPSGMSGKCVNTPEHPGMLIWHCGQADFQGNFTFVGILYNANNSDGTCASWPAKNPATCFTGSQNATPNDLIVTNGGFGVWGALAIDGGGCLHVGSNGLQVKYDLNAFNAARSYGTVGLVQNSWRELKPQ